MASVGATIEINEADVRRIAQRVNRAVQPTPALLDSIGQLLADSAVERINSTHVGPSGESWPEWSDAYAAWRAERGGEQTKLRLEGHLQQSVTWNVNGDSVEVGSNLEYAAVHQFGYKKIPARPYLGVSESDGRRVLQRVERAILAGLGGAS